MSLDTVRAVFLAEGRGKLRLDRAALRYQGKHQVLHFTGWVNEGSAFGVPFAFVSPPFDGDPVMRAAQIAVDMVRLHTGKSMSLLGKMNALTESAQDFNTQTGAKLDELQARLKPLAVKRDAALAKHHSYYDGIERGLDESTVVIDKLSNGPLDGGSGN